jgi:periplasmic divalent cation tolerance protein
MKLIAVYTTVATLQDARRIAQALVERRLAACAQISEIESFYVWNGVVHHEPERRIVFKTTADRYAAVESAIRELHPYELPAIHAVPIEHASSQYAAWVEEGSRGE